MTTHRITIREGEPFIVGRNFVVGTLFEHRLDDDFGFVFREFDPARLLETMTALEWMYRDYRQRWVIGIGDDND